MKNEKLIPSLIEEDKTSLPKRGGNYVSEESKEKARFERAQKKLRECNCNCDCDCDCDCHDCNC